MGPRGHYEWRQSFILPPSASALAGSKTLGEVQASFESALPAHGFFADVGHSHPGGQPFTKTFRDPSARSFCQTFHDILVARHTNVR
jgi:hypothetical protein